MNVFHVKTWGKDILGQNLPCQKVLSFFFPLSGLVLFLICLNIKRINFTFFFLKMIRDKGTLFNYILKFWRGNGTPLPSLAGVFRWGKF